MLPMIRNGLNGVFQDSHSLRIAAFSSAFFRAASAASMGAPAAVRHATEATVMTLRHFENEKSLNSFTGTVGCSQIVAAHSMETENFCSLALAHGRWEFNPKVLNFALFGNYFWQSVYSTETARPNFTSVRRDTLRTMSFLSFAVI
jgi:hypothetical protein